MILLRRLLCESCHHGDATRLVLCRLLLVLAVFLPLFALFDAGFSFLCHDRVVLLLDLIDIHRRFRELHMQRLQRLGASGIYANG